MTTAVINHMQRLVNEFVELCLLSERMMGRGEFKLSEFKKLDEPFKMIAYVDEVLKKLGEGSSRATYLLSSGKALKIAIPNNEDKGRAQNQSELDVYTNPRTKPVVAKIFDYDPRYNWLISELVRPIDADEFKKHFKLSIKTLMDTTLTVYEAESNADDYLQSKPKIAKLFSMEARSFIDACVNLIEENELSTGDLEVVNHWGKTTSGRIVLLDYGLTHDVYSAHYSDENPGSQAITAGGDQ